MYCLSDGAGILNQRIRRIKMPISENNTTFVADDNSSLLGKELEFITIDAGEELANHQF